MFSLQIQDIVCVQFTHPGYDIFSVYKSGIRYIFILQIRDMIYFQFTNPGDSIFSVYKSRI